MSAQKKILVTGAIAFDHLFTYDATFLEHLKKAAELEQLSVSFQPSKYVRRNGGTGANIAWNLSLLKSNPLLVGNIGPDGLEYKEILTERGIDTTYVDIKKTSMTATGVCCTDTRQHQIWFFYQGADTVGHWPNLTDALPDISYAIIGPRWRPTMLEALEWCKNNNVPAVFDPGQEILKFQTEELKTAIARASAVIVNDFEWGMIQSRIGGTPEELAATLDYLIITHGEEGHSIYSDGKKESYPRCNAEKAIDPTGAGDAFRAGLLTGLTKGWSLGDASKLGAAVASFVVEQEGTLLEMLDMDLLKKRLKEAYGEELPEL